MNTEKEKNKQNYSNKDILSSLALDMTYYYLNPETGKPWDATAEPEASDLGDGGKGDKPAKIIGEVGSKVSLIPAAANEFSNSEIGKALWNTSKEFEFTSENAAKLAAIPGKIAKTFLISDVVFLGVSASDDFANGHNFMGWTRIGTGLSIIGIGVLCPPVGIGLGLLEMGYGNDFYEKMQAYWDFCHH